VNLDLISRITARLRSSAVIGAFALAARGFIRHTSDFDLLTLDTRSLDPQTWDDLRQQGFDADVRKGDVDDPLAGVVRIKSGDVSIDVIVARIRALSPAANDRPLIRLRHLLPARRGEGLSMFNSLSSRS